MERIRGPGLITIYCRPELRSAVHAYPRIDPQNNDFFLSDFSPGE